MPDLNPPPSDRERAESILKCLSRSLGCSVEAFSGQDSHELSHTLELLNLWLTIDDRQDRMKALALLRNVKVKGEAMDGITVPAPGEPMALSHAVQKPDRAP